MVLDRDDEGQADDRAVDDARDLLGAEVGFERVGHSAAQLAVAPGDAASPARDDRAFTPSG
jgi:hypothetical protein